MNNAVIQPLVRCGASEELETPELSLWLSLFLSLCLFLNSNRSRIIIQTSRKETNNFGEDLSFFYEAKTGSKNKIKYKTQRRGMKST